ncbi:MAG: DUF5011 domain-containing protein, partial [Bacteroidia bacterium]|nr:DUF5011 domain-containing protein [Bacteroidia bacterium]
TKEKGIYTVTYSVSDDAGNTGTATRTVKVVNSAEKYMGDYEVTTVSSNPVIAPSYTIEYDISLESDKKFNWMFKLPKLCKISSLKANAYIGKDAEGDNIPTIPKGYEITIIQTEMKIAGASPGDTTWYRISNYKVGENFSKLDTVINKYTIRYIIERQYPYDPENPDQNMQNGIITETYIRSY